MRLDRQECFITEGKEEEEACPDETNCPISLQSRGSWRCSKGKTRRKQQTNTISMEDHCKALCKNEDIKHPLE